MNVSTYLQKPHPMMGCVRHMRQKSMDSFEGRWLDRDMFEGGYYLKYHKERLFLWLTFFFQVTTWFGSLFSKVVLIA
jgi:hypothetical protein